MSFFPNFNLQSIQDSLPKVDLESFSKSFQNVNPGKTVSDFKDSIQPFTAKTQQLISSQLQQVQQLAATHSNSSIEVSELPTEYLELERNCDLLLKLYTDLIQYTNDTYGNVSYDYPPGNTAISKIKDAHVGLMLSAKFNQLKNVSTPQEMEKILLGQTDAPAAETDTVNIQVTSAQLPRTLYGQLAQIASKNGDEFTGSEDTLSFVLLKISSAYLEIGVARLEQDKKIMTNLNHALVQILNEQFIKVNELRKKVYSARLEFDVVRAKDAGEEEEENEELIAKEDDLVSATEVAVLEMRKLLKPSKNVDLLKVFVAAQKEFFDAASKKLDSLLTELDKVEIKDEDEE